MLQCTRSCVILFYVTYFTLHLLPSTNYGWIRSQFWVVSSCLCILRCTAGQVWSVCYWPFCSSELTGLLYFPCFTRKCKFMLPSLPCVPPCPCTVITFEPTESFMKHDLSIVPLDATSSSLIFNFLSLVVTTWLLTSELNAKLASFNVGSDILCCRPNRASKMIVLIEECNTAS